MKQCLGLSAEKKCRRKRDKREILHNDLDLYKLFHVIKKRKKRGEF